uniref:Uncharacterized protein n=1 Tax=Eptatretus burgeri TaxID=7764 RepID=A0A8C4NG52_EPTBU
MFNVQDTVMALQALTGFESCQSRMKKMDLSFKIRAEENGVFDKEFQITNDNAFVQKPFKVPVHGQLTVTASGTGQGILTFVKKYREKVVIKKDCKGFSLEITTNLDSFVLHSAGCPYHTPSSARNLVGEMVSSPTTRPWNRLVQVYIVPVASHRCNLTWPDSFFLYTLSRLL